MKTKVTTLLSISAFALILLASCAKDAVDSTVKSYTDAEYSIISKTVNLPLETAQYKNPDLPPHFGSAGFLGNTISDHGATLGRVLFFDKRLSAAETVSCSSCHHQENAFADARALSIGHEGEETHRNSIALGNVRFYYHDRGFFWDERANSVEDQVRQTVSNHVEMGVAYHELGAKLENDEMYKILFSKAFGDSQVTSDRVANALAQYVRSIISHQSKFDAAVEDATNGASWVNLENTLPMYTDPENLGRELYVQNCASCHGNIVFLGRATANNGLDMVYEDKGVGALTNNDFDNGVFKVPHLRNIALSGPYMHDGRFESLEEVIDHYSEGVQSHPNLSPILQDANGQAKKMNFSSDEKVALIAFLETLTDEAFTQEEKYFDPFK